jgi:hypothetical protein
MQGVRSEIRGSESRVQGWFLTPRPNSVGLRKEKGRRAEVGILVSPPINRVVGRRRSMDGLPAVFLLGVFCLFSKAFLARNLCADIFRLLRARRARTIRPAGRGGSMQKIE